MVLEAVLGTSSAPARMCINVMTAPSQLTPTAPTSVMLQSRMLRLLRGATVAETQAANEHPHGTRQQDVPSLESPHSTHGGGGWMRLQQQLLRFGQEFEEEDKADDKAIGQGWAGLVAVEGGAAECLKLLGSTRVNEGKSAELSSVETATLLQQFMERLVATDVQGGFMSVLGLLSGKIICHSSHGVLLGTESKQRRESRAWGEMMASLFYWVSQGVQKDSKTPFWDQNSYYMLRGLVTLHVHAAEDDDAGLQLPEPPLRAKSLQGNGHTAPKWRRPVASPEWVSWAGAAHSTIQNFVRARAGLLLPVNVLARPPSLLNTEQPEALRAPAHVGRLQDQGCNQGKLPNSVMHWMSSDGLRAAAELLRRAPSLKAEAWVSQALKAMHLSTQELHILCESPLKDLLCSDGSRPLKTDVKSAEATQSYESPAEVPFVLPTQQSAAARRLMQRTKHDIATYLKERRTSAFEPQLACVPYALLRALQLSPCAAGSRCDGDTDVLLEEACANLNSLQKLVSEKAAYDEEAVRLLSKLLAHSTAPTTRCPPEDTPTSALAAWWCWSLRRQSAQQAEYKEGDWLSLLVSCRPTSVLHDATPPAAASVACTATVVQSTTVLILLYAARGRLLRQVAAHLHRLSALLSSIATALSSGSSGETLEGRPLKDVATEAEQLCQMTAAVLGTKRCWLHTVSGDKDGQPDLAAAAAADGDAGSSTATGELQVGVDATILTFEYLTGYFLRPRQVELVRELSGVGIQGGARVTQMLMGEGKTTVVAPLLALVLADGQRSVAICVPAPLIPQTRDVLSRTFGRIWPRRVTEFEFDRLSVPVEGRSVQISHMRLRALGRLLRRGRLEGAVVLCTPATLQSMQLKCIELMAASDRKVGIDAANAAIEARDADRGDKASEAAAASFNARQALRGAQEQMSAILRMWGEEQRGALILDEVDLVMSPLRAEVTSRARTHHLGSSGTRRS